MVSQVNQNLVDVMLYDFKIVNPIGRKVVVIMVNGHILTDKCTQMKSGKRILSSI